MKQEVLSHFNYPALPIIGMIIFATIFTVMLFWVLSKNRDALYQEASNLPLDEKGASHE